MQRILLLTTFLLLSLGLMAAQDQSAASNSKSGHKETTMRGCLRGAPSAFTLTSDDGTTYQLVGDNGQLGHLVGKEVMLKGEPTSANLPTGALGNTGTSASNSGAATGPSFTVNSAKKIADQCGK